MRVGTVEATATTGPSRQEQQRRQSQPRPAKVLTMETINPCVVETKYAVRGRVPVRAQQLQKELEENPGSKPFDKIVFANIGNPQKLNQMPITFPRQVLSLLDYPALLEPEKEAVVSQLFAPDAVQRAKDYIQAGVRVGAYSTSAGVEIVREEVAAFISERDGFPCEANNIVLTSGASAGVARILSALIQHPKVGILVPVPQYPLYSATITLLNGTMVPYYLDEERQWSLTVEELERSLATAKASGVDVRVICIIHPGNPTGQCMKADQIKEIIRFAHRNRLVILADEVYQKNCYLEAYPFHSIRKCLLSMPDIAADQEVISFHSISKGTLGECGRRGGYFEFLNTDPEVKAQILKLGSVSLCPNIIGQVMVGLMVNPPKEGDASYETYVAENSAIFESLKRRATKLSQALNELRLVTCNESMGSMYLFPKIGIPERAVEVAKKQDLSPDEFYCLQLLEETGVCVVPGSGFKQSPGTFHFRTTFLPPEDAIDSYIGAIKEFHERFLAQYE